MKRPKRTGEGRPRKKECECGRSIEKEWDLVGSERVCLRCKELDGLTDSYTGENVKFSKTETMEKWIYRHSNKWVVKRKINNSLIYLGSFDAKSDAVKCRDKNLDLMNK